MSQPPPAETRRRPPKTWTADRKAQAKTILDPWWTTYGHQQTQTYVAIFGVLIAALGNGIDDNRLIWAMGHLGKDKQPISGGSLQYALAKYDKSADAIFAEETRYRDPETYRDSQEHWLAETPDERGPEYWASLKM